MTRILAIAGTALLVAAAAASAQQPVTIDDLTAPTSPAFVLLDVSPSAVERPENARTFTVNLLNRVTTSKGLPQNYALEVAPYWLASHPQLTFQTYQRPSVGQSLAQSLSVSVATVPLPGATASADPLGTRIGLGLRTNVWNGRPNPVLEARVADLADANGRLLDILARQPADDAARATMRTDEEEARQEIRSLSLEVQGLDAERIGFFLTLAAGQVWSYREDDVSQSSVDRRAVWITPSYRFRPCRAGTCDARIDLIAVLRALKDQAVPVRWDYGGRVMWRAGRELYLSLESVRRQERDAAGTVPASDASHRTVGMIEYRIRPDLVVFGSFGRDFQKDTGAKPLVSLLGLNLGFGKKPVVLADAPGP